MEIERRVVMANQCREDLRWFILNDPPSAVRMLKLIDAGVAEPFKGIGKPEPLKHWLAGCWSRRVNEVDRLVYQVKADRIESLQGCYHYE
ncbi:MAG: Txe/YoeB family addiction module toxin [Candidatus Dormibacteraceae bacterium]